MFPSLANKTNENSNKPRPQSNGVIQQPLIAYSSTPRQRQNRPKFHRPPPLLFLVPKPLDGLGNACNGFFFAEDREDGREVGAGLLTGDGDAHRLHHTAEAKTTLFNEVVERFVDRGLIEGFQGLENFGDFFQGLENAVLEQFLFDGF